MLGKLKKRKPEERSLYKKQPEFFDAKPEGIDFISPSIMKETMPKDISAEGMRMTDYAVEVGGTAEFTRYYRSFFAEIAAGNTWAGMLDSLVLGQFGEADMDLAIHIRPAANDRELEAIGRRISGLLSDIATERDFSKKEAMKDEIIDLKSRQSRIRRNVEKSYRVSIQAVASCSDWTQLRKFCNSLVKLFSGKSIVLRAADGRQLSSLLAVLPLSSSAVPKEHFLSFESSNVADLFPFGHGGISHRTGIILGRDSLRKPVWLDSDSPTLTNKHICVIGRSGAGKTYVIMVYVHQSLHIGRSGAILDWKGEYRDYMIAMNCPYIELSVHSKHRINIYDVDITELPDGTRFVDIEEAANAVQAIVFKMISVYDRSALTGEVQVFIGNSIRRQYADAGITSDVESLYVNGISEGGKFKMKKKMRRMPELNELQRMMENESDSKGIRYASELLKPFTKNGETPSYAIFDGQSTFQVNNSPIFAIALNQLDKKIMRPIGLVVAERWITEKWAKRNIDISKFMIIEEAQNIFNDPDVGAVWAESAYREYRTTNTGIISVTQGLEVFTQSPAGIAAIKNSPVKIIGIQEKIDIESVQGKLDLTEGEADFLVRKATKGNIVLKVNNESTFVKVEATEFEHMLFTTDPADPAFPRRKEYIRNLLAEREKKNQHMREEVHAEAEAVGS